MTEKKRDKKDKKANDASHPSLIINLQVAIPRKAAWMASGIVTGSIFTEALLRLLTSMHGG